MEEAIKWDGQTIIDIYKKGIAGGLKTTIVEMTIEAYQSLKSGFRLSPIILSGEALHRLNCEIILHYAKLFGSIEYDSKKHNKEKFYLLGEQVTGDFGASFYLIDNLTLCDTIYILKNKNLIDESTFSEMHVLRYLRNCAVHKLLLPRIDPYYPSPSLSKEEFEEVVFRSLNSKMIPLKYRQHKFNFEIKKGEKQVYIVNQKELGIEIENVKSELRIPTISLAVLLSIMRQINSLLPLKK